MKKFNFLYLSLGILFLSIIIITLLNFFDVFSVKFSNIIIYILFFILLSFNSFKISLKSKDKGYITGIKIASIISFIIIISKFIVKIKFSFSSFIYLLLIFVFSIIPAIYGSNKKSSNS